MPGLRIRTAVVGGALASVLVAMTVPVQAAAPTAERSYTAFSACMKRNGVTLDARTSSRPTNGPSSRPTAQPSGGASRPRQQVVKPKNVSQAKFDRAMRICKPLLPTPGAKASPAPTR